MPLDLKLTPERVSGAVSAAVRATALELGAKIRETFDDSRFTWETTTHRHNGAVAGTPRDVVDLGTLRDSQTEPQPVGPLAYRIEWTADHASAVLLGATFRKREYSMPGRNVPAVALMEFDLAGAFARHVKGKLS